MTTANQGTPDFRDQEDGGEGQPRQGGKSGPLGPRPGSGVNKRTTKASAKGGRAKKSLLRRSLDPDNNNNNNNMNPNIPFVSTPADTPSPFPEPTPLQSDADAKYEGERARNNQSAKRSRIRKALYVVELDNAVTGYEYNFKLFYKMYKEAKQKLIDHGLGGDLPPDPPIWVRKPIPVGQDVDTQEYRKKLETAVESGELVPLGLDFAESVALQVGKTTGSAQQTEEAKALQDAKDKYEKTVKQEDKYAEELQDMEKKMQELQHKLWEVQHNRQSLGNVVDRYQARVSGQLGENNAGPSTLQGNGTNLPYRPPVPETAHLPQRLQKMASQGRKERTLEELAASWPVRSCLENPQMAMEMDQNPSEAKLEQAEDARLDGLPVPTFDGYHHQSQQQQANPNHPTNPSFAQWCQAQGEPSFLDYSNASGNPDAVSAGNFNEYPWPGEGVDFTGGESHFMISDDHLPGTGHDAVLPSTSQPLSPSICFADLHLSPEMGNMFMDTGEQSSGDPNHGNYHGSYGQQTDQFNQFY
ncbi:hypothetical protein GE21DRAFT_6372 [Neurospora crassa]|uniref:BZIP domain-containing protein n=1 Tax=Neurospora crassa (strain ATCC 24698 / 74-OR23-1A / CBS 708.71 / DSM 1257 / FGSC 987) TaxID=367110 RepID=Q7SA50_NEUCR|nr:hypothetical protein NCU07312 [Neurospora crassa OR74A]EAA33234.1 hypothetical protein NCU07312 [Neurospora crassa OR74A]KHE88740.1 hypothetical protein GE21DRAFT_6372 [Neurospora crassa]|eukprot:XP_962470.1 hypothetical protein NCU07312 [Neurospora crassa OR74A]